MRLRFLVIGFFLFPIMRIGTGLLHTPGKASQNETASPFFKSFQNKMKCSAPNRFWEITNEKKGIATDTAALKQSGWYAKAINTINAKEYEISYDEKLKSYMSPNRKNDLRALYTTSTFTLSPRNDSADKWNLKLVLQGIYSGKEKIYSPDVNASVTRSGQAIRFNHNNDFIVEYINNEEGVRQNFIIQKAPVSQPKTINIKLQANRNWFVNKVNDTEIHFAKAKRDGYDKKITYNGLKVWDAENKKLDAFFTVNNNEIGIKVQTQNAVYPITIDPLSSSPSAMLEVNQAGAQFGCSVSSAGDVNGDGYSDVIVGARSYDNGQVNEGAAFVFNGSASGISTTASAMFESNQADAAFGCSVSTACDINGDGYSDVIVGADYFDSGQTDEGAAFIYHGSATGLNTIPSAIIESNQANALFGISVASAGDVNGDGYSDVIVGANYFDNGQTDEGAAFIYHGSATGINTTASAILDKNQAGASLGFSVASAGDANGDGYSDVIIGSPQFDNGETDEGAAFVYYGSASGINTSMQTHLEANQSNAHFGFSVSCAGDVNNDGYSDVIAGAKDFDNGETDEGAAFIYVGTSAGTNNATMITQLEGNQVNALMGYSVACAGDVNADGYSDIIVGVPGFLNGQVGEGGAFIYHGSISGIHAIETQLESNQVNGAMGISVASAGDVNGDGYSDAITGSPQYDNGQTDEGAAFVYHGGVVTVTDPSLIIEANQDGTQMGASVASAGDVNGDGYSDVLVGAYSYDNGEIDEGVVFVYYGTATGISGTANVMLEFNQAYAFMGVSVASAGDVNGDGYSDIIVGVSNYTNGENREGAAFIYHGSSTGVSNTMATLVESNKVNALLGWSVASAGDVNRDGYGDIIVGASYLENGQTDGAAAVYHGSATGIVTTIATMLDKGSSVAGAGDVNADGYSDVIVGSNLYSNGQTSEGAAFVYYGSSTGISNTPNVQLEGNQETARMGCSVAGAGDINGDGYSDIIVGAFRYDNGETNEGVAFIYHGSATGIIPTPAGMVESNMENAELGYSVASSGDINGDGYSDVIVGAIRYGVTQYTNEGAAFVYYGSATGINTNAALTLRSNINDTRMGASVACGGDINGDGYSDVIVGATNYSNGEYLEGAAYVYLGNDGGSRSNMRLYNADLVTPIQRNNIFTPNLFGVGLYAKSLLGRAKGKLVWEVKAQGVPFSGNPITNSTSFLAKQSSFTDLGINGTELKNQVVKQGLQNKIRVRAEYDKVTTITGQIYGPWRYPVSYSMGADGANSTPLPLTLISFNGRFINHSDVQLKWVTTNEMNLQQFIIERSEDGNLFTVAGALSAKGTGAGNTDYAFMDKNVNADLLYYRLKLKEQSGDISYSHIVKLSRSKKTDGFIAPNPVQRNTDAILNIHSTIDNTVRIQVFNISGQVIIEKDVLLHNGNNQIRIPTNGFSKGMYVVSVRGKTIKETYNFTVQ
jgi:FG-GAP repeat/FG-GAP-like repeat/Secretion system C-terminal sorting domain